MGKKLGQMLVSDGRITEEQLELALERQAEMGGKLGECLVELGLIENEDEIREILNRQFGSGALKLSEMELEPDVVNLVPGDMARKFGAIAVDRDGNSLTVAVSNPPLPSVAV